ncbi:hypothetical protein MG293_010430 [Ovis ammon polii]|uniref:KH-like RNA-binding domain-containing protein n=1 Tax=Ovis ammon polii TaxID=230172 RepID=A0AAD4UAJ2_OVIAM|nr:hypothetical protein MG293_010430 [Ovis ammon polii]
MAAPWRFPTLVQLEQREGTLFEVLGNLTKRPYWFHSEYLKSPKAVHLEAWLVEAIFGSCLDSSLKGGPGITSTMELGHCKEFGEDERLEGSQNHFYKCIVSKMQSSGNGRSKRCSKWRQQSFTSKILKQRVLMNMYSQCS